MNVGPEELPFYELPNGKRPFEEWLNSLGVPERVKVEARLKKVTDSGNLGSFKYLGAGVSELKFAGRYGHLRVYYAVLDSRMMLLHGGHKDTQSRDIEQAKRYLADYEQREGQDDI
jgi:putative addiction module killer protein